MEEDTDLFVTGYGGMLRDDEAALHRDYKRNEGFLLVDDVGHKAMAAMALAEVDMLRSWPSGAFAVMSSVSPSVGSLMLVSRHLQESLPRSVRSAYDMRRHFGVDDTEQAKAKSGFVFEGGLGDMGFTWHFAPVVAAEVARTFVRQGLLTPEQRGRLSLADWADMVGSYWFSDVMHDLALTRNGIYQDAGNWFGHFTNIHEDSLVRHISSRFASFDPKCRGQLERHGMFVVDTTKEESSGMTYLTAKVHPALRRILREQMHKLPRSVGCPVARRAGTLAVENIADNRHFQSLVARGELEVSYEAEGNKVRFKQDYTPIDRGLDGLARQLESYGEKYGNPRRRRNPGSIGPDTDLIHVKLPKAGVLSFPS